MIWLNTCQYGTYLTAMKQQGPRRHSPDTWHTVLLCSITVFAVLPAIFDIGVYHDALWGWAVLALGVCLGVYRGVHDMVWKGPHRGVVIPAACVVGAICVSIFAGSAFAGWSHDEVVPGLVAAAGKAAAVAIGAVLGTNLGWRYKAGNRRRHIVLGRELALLAVIFASAWAVAHAQCSGVDLFQNGVVALQYADPSIALAGAALGAGYGSYKVRQGGQFLYLVLAFGFLTLAHLAHVWSLTDELVCRDVMSPKLGFAAPWPVLFGVIAAALSMFGGLLGASWSAYVKKRIGAC